MTQLQGRAAELVRLLQLSPHPEGGWFREIFRSDSPLSPGDGRTQRCALTSIDFVLGPGEFSAWHRVLSDEAWHLLEGGPLRLWLMPPDLGPLRSVDLKGVSPQGAPRHVVPAGWWQAAEPLGDFAYAGATVAPGFDFADFAFGRDDAALRKALGEQAPDLLRLF